MKTQKTILGNTKKMMTKIADDLTKNGLTNPKDCDILIKLSRGSCGLVAQLDRVFDYESKGRGFESRRAHVIGRYRKMPPDPYFSPLPGFLKS